MELTYPAPGLPKHQIIRTEGYWTHTEGTRLLDILCGNTAYIFGFSDQTILREMSNIQQLVGFLKGTANETCLANDKLIEQLCSIGNFASVSWAVSGSDGVELAVSTNDQYWKSLGEDRPTVAVFNPNYHGTTYLAKVFRGQYPANDRCVSVSSLNELSIILSSNKAIGAVLMESCPWIDRVSPWSQEHWETVRQLCDQYNINFIVDDVLGGVGKLGYVFSHQRYNVQPDIVVLGKALTAGYTPLSCACVNQRITEAVKNNWDYGHTWSPNMAGVGAALEVLRRFDIIHIQDLENRLNMLGQLLLQADVIEDYTSIGLLLDLKLKKSYPANTLIKNELNGTIKDNNTIMICAPMIAGGSYFNWLHQKLLLALSNK
jgi:adenosylmethionine-8-amino-7-oxononanoate aminotransferase